MPAVWGSRYPAHISPSCSVASQISAYSRPCRPHTPSGPAFPVPLPLRAQLTPTAPQRWGRKAALEARRPSPARFAYFLLAPKQDISQGK